MDDEDFREFVIARGPALQRTAYLLTGDHQLAEDLVQTALAKTFLRLRHVRLPAALEGYVRQVMYREQVSWWRRRRPAESLSAYPPDGTASVSESGAVDERLAMRTALLRLGPRQRAVLVLRYFEDLSEVQVADQLGISVGTVKSQTAKALRRLRTDDGGLAPAARLGGTA